MIRPRILLLLLAGWTGGCVSPAAPPTVARPAPALRVVLVSVDGLRPDAIDRADAPHLRRLRARGASSPDAETVRPSITLPSHASMLTGLDFPRHGVVWNNYRPGHIAHPTILSVVARHGGSTAILFAKDKFHHLADPAEGHWIYGPPIPLKAPPAEDVTDPRRLERLRRRELAERQPTAEPPAGDDRPRRPKPGDLMTTADLLARAFEEAWPAWEFRLTVVHFRECDDAGHRSGWMGPDYLDAVRTVDAAIGRIVGAIEAKDGFRRTALIVTSDHGGSGRGHHRVAEPDRAENVRIPWIAAGPGVPQGITIRRAVRTVDTAPTVLAFLGLEPPAGIDGTRVAEILTGPVPPPHRP